MLWGGGGRYAGDSDAKFLKDLVDSHASVRRTVEMLRESGLTEAVGDYEVRPTVLESGGTYGSDNGDIRVGRLRVEVKQRRLDFDSIETFPYPTVAIEMAHEWRAAEAKGDAPFGYVLWNKDLTFCAGILGETRPKWEERTVWDRFKRRHRRTLLAPKSCFVSWDVFLDSLSKAVATT